MTSEDMFRDICATIESADSHYFLASEQVRLGASKDWEKVNTREEESRWRGLF